MTMMMGGKVHRTRSKARRSAGGVPGAFLQGVDGTRIPLTPDDYRRVREFLLAEPERAVADDERITNGGAQLPFPEAFGCDRLQAQARRGHIQGVG